MGGRGAALARGATAILVAPRIFAVVVPLDAFVFADADIAVSPTALLVSLRGGAIGGGVVVPRPLLCPPRTTAISSSFRWNAASMAGSVPMSLITVNSLRPSFGVAYLCGKERARERESEGGGGKDLVLERCRTPHTPVTHTHTLHGSSRSAPPPIPSFQPSLSDVQFEAYAEQSHQRPGCGDAADSNIGFRLRRCPG